MVTGLASSAPPSLGLTELVAAPRPLPRSSCPCSSASVSRARAHFSWWLVLYCRRQLRVTSVLTLPQPQAPSRRVGARGSRSRVYAHWRAHPHCPLSLTHPAARLYGGDPPGAAALHEGNRRRQEGGLQGGCHSRQRLLEGGRQAKGCRQEGVRLLEGRRQARGGWQGQGEALGSCGLEGGGLTAARAASWLEGDVRPHRRAARGPDGGGGHDGVRGVVRARRRGGHGVPDPRLSHALLADQGHRQRRSHAQAARARPERGEHTADRRRDAGRPDPRCQLPQQQGQVHQGRLPPTPRAARRPRAREHGGAPSAAWRGAQDGCPPHRHTPRAPPHALCTATLPRAWRQRSS